MLAPHHRALLAERAVTGPVLDRRGYETITNWQDLMAAGFPEGQARRYGRGLLIPRYGLDGRRSWPKFRPDMAGRNGPIVNAQGKEIKYASPGGSWNFLDALPGTNLRGELWVSAEGFLKSDAMTAAGVATVAFDGVWGWRSQGEALLGLQALAGPRWFHVVCDSDVEMNPVVASAMFRLGAWMRREGCKVRLLHPPGPGKCGVDDFLAGGGRLDGLVAFRMPSPQVRQQWARRRMTTSMGAR